MEQKDPFDGLDDKQKEDTLNLMQIANIEDGAIARQFMEMSHWDVNAAVQCYFETGGAAGSGAQNHNNIQEEQKQDMYHPPPPEQQMFNADHDNHQDFMQQEMLNMYQQIQSANNQQIQGVNPEQLRKYKQYLEQKKILDQNKGIVKKSISGIANVSKSLWNTFVPVAIRGETPGGEEFNSYVYKNLNLKQTYNFENGTFQENLEKATQQARPLVVVIFSESSPVRDLQVKLLQDKDLIKEYNKSFRVIGLLNSSQESQIILKDVPSDKWPAFAFYRKNLFERNTLIEAVPITSQQQESKYYYDKAREIRSKFYMQVSEDEKIRKAEKAQRRVMVNPYEMQERMFYQVQQNLHQVNNQPNPQQQQQQQQRQQQIQQERLLKEQQEKEYQEMIKQSEEEEKRKYEEQKKKEEEEVQKIIEQQLYEEELKQRKEKLQVEPAEGAEGVVTIAFRLPDGSKLTRRFMLSDKPSILFDFIETKDEIQFEHIEDNGGKKLFDLMMTHPTRSLKAELEKDQTLDEVFEGSEYEQVHVREL